MKLLINRTDIAEYRQISKTVFDKVLNQHILDAQFIDVQKLLGADFYNDLIRNYTDSKYTTLLDGEDYTYQSVTYTLIGLKAVIIHYAYSRYILAGSQTDTPFGYVEKTNDNSQSVSDNSKKNMWKSNQQAAFNYWENVMDYLDRNASTFPLWETSCASTNQTFKISKIGGTSRGRPMTASRFSYE